MPNHVKNRLVIKATGEKLKEVLDYLKGEPFEMRPDCEESYELVDGEYKYKEEAQ